MGFELDVAPLAAAIRLKAQVAEKALPEVVNKAMKDVALRAIGFMPAVPSAVIAAEVRRTVATRYVSKTGRTLKRPKNTYEASDFLDADGNARGGLLIMLARLRKAGKLKGMNGAEIRQMALRMANARVRSGSYLKAGELAAAQAFGASSTTGDTHLYHAPGEGILATSSSLVAELRNNVPVANWKNTPGGETAYEAAENALQSALDFVERDILIYLDRKLREAEFAD